MSVSAVIVTHDGWPLLRECLTALREQVRRPDQVLVVDNGSRDETRSRLWREFPEVEVVDAERNLGFAAGNNLGIKRSSGDVVVLLNNDAIAEPEFVGALTAPLGEDPLLGASAASMVFSRAPDIVASAGIRVFANGVALDRGVGLPLGELNRDVEVFGASAGAAAYRRAALTDVGLFAEPFFMYLEDVDLAWRLRLRGWSTLHATGAIVRHHYSASAAEGSPLKRRLLARNRMWTITRCVPGPLLWRNLHRIVAYDAGAFGYALVHGDGASARGRLEGVAGLPSRLRERRAIQARAATPASALARWLEPSPAPSEILRLRRLTASLATGPRVDIETHVGRASGGG